MRQIPTGATSRFTLRVLPEHLANQFKDAMLPQVLATPVMILIMENAALNAIRSFLDSGESEVDLAPDEVVPGDRDLLVLGVAIEADELHAVEEGGRDRVGDVRRCEEQ